MRLLLFLATVVFSLNAAPVLYRGASCIGPGTLTLTIREVASCDVVNYSDVEAFMRRGFYPVSGAFAGHWAQLDGNTLIVGLHAAATVDATMMSTGVFTASAAMRQDISTNGPARWGTALITASWDYYDYTDESFTLGGEPVLMTGVINCTPGPVPGFQLGCSLAMPVRLGETITIYGSSEADNRVPGGTPWQSGCCARSWFSNFQITARFVEQDGVTPVMLYDNTSPTATIPEPATASAMLISLSGMFLIQRRRTSKQLPPGNVG